MPGMSGRKASMVDDTWEAVRDRLDSELTALNDCDALVVSEPEPPEPEAVEKRGFLGGWRRARRAPVRYVQFYCWGDSYEAECVGPGGWDSTTPQREQLIADGWEQPAPGDGAQTDNFVRLARIEDHRQVAGAAVEALATLGCDPSTAWVWDRITD